MPGKKPKDRGKSRWSVRKKYGPSFDKLFHVQRQEVENHCNDVARFQQDTIRNGHNRVATFALLYGASTHRIAALLQTRGESMVESFRRATEAMTQFGVSARNLYRSLPRTGRAQNQEAPPMHDEEIWAFPRLPDISSFLPSLASSTETTAQEMRISDYLNFLADRRHREYLFQSMPRRNQLINALQGVRTEETRANVLRLLADPCGELSSLMRMPSMADAAAALADLQSRRHEEHVMTRALVLHRHQAIPPDTLDARYCRLRDCIPVSAQNIIADAVSMLIRDQDSAARSNFTLRELNEVIDRARVNLRYVEFMIEHQPFNFLLTLSPSSRYQETIEQVPYSVVRQFQQALQMQYRNRRVMDSRLTATALQQEAIARASADESINLGPGRAVISGVDYGMSNDFTMVASSVVEPNDQQEAIRRMIEEHMGRRGFQPASVPAQRSTAPATPAPAYTRTPLRTVFGRQVVVTEKGIKVSEPRESKKTEE